MLAFCGARIRSGFEIVAERIGLAAAIADADIVVTGEGRLDAQTIEGKAPASVAGLARAEGKRVFAIVGSVAGEAGELKLFDRVHALIGPIVTSAAAMQNTRELLRLRARELAHTL